MSGTVTNVTVTEINTDTTYETIGDFIEMTDTFVYTETITESVETVTSTTTFVTQETQTENLLTTSVQMFFPIARWTYMIVVILRKTIVMVWEVM